MRRPRAGLRVRLMLTTLAAALLAVCALIAGFNVLLDARLRSDADGVLRERAAAALRDLSIAGGRLRVPESPDRAAADVQTWIFVGGRALEQPPVPSGESLTAKRLAARGGGLASDERTRSRLYAVPIIVTSRRLGTLVVGASLKPYDASARSALLASLLLGAAILLGVAVLARWVIRRSLDPVARMTSAAAEWGEHDLSRRFLAGEPHDELTELAATFDRLLDRVDASLRRERHFTAEISHELRHPLARITAAAELAAAPGREAEHYRAALEAILRAAGELAGSLDALLAVARADAAATPLPIDAHTVAEQAVQRVTRSLGAREITIELDGRAGGIRIAADRDLAERALAPILDNAARFAEHRVVVAISRRGSEVLFTIIDDGPGVDPEIRDRVFEPGVSRAAPGGPGSGAGLGLPLARRLATAAGGEVECVPAQRGATFVLRLPAA